LGSAINDADEYQPTGWMRLVSGILHNADGHGRITLADLQGLGPFSTPGVEEAAKKT